MNMFVPSCFNNVLSSCNSRTSQQVVRNSLVAIRVTLLQLVASCDIFTRVSNSYNNRLYIDMTDLKSEKNLQREQLDTSLLL